MLGEPRNKLDDIAEELAELASQLTLQAAKRRALEKHIASNAPSMSKRCYAEDDEEPYHNDNKEGFCDKDFCAMMRTMGRIEGRLTKFLDNRIFEYDEDEIQELTHEQIYEEIHRVYEEGGDILSEFINL